MTVLAFYSTPDPYADDGVPFFKSHERAVTDRLADSAPPLQLVPDEDPEPSHWREQALCAEIDPELFFPEKGASNLAEARAACRACPVTAQCLLEAVAADQPPFGIWGGTSAKERIPLRAAHRAAQRRHRRQLSARRAAGRVLRTARRPYRERTRQSA